MPKQRITKEMVVDAAFELMRESGMEQVLVKNIAEKIGCSVQPIYSYCNNMEGLRKELEDRSSKFIGEYMQDHIDKSDLFRSTGYAYLQLAQEEPAIFRMHVLRQRENISSLDDLYRSETNPMVAEVIAKSLKISKEDAQKLHLSMLIFNVGIGTILASTSSGIPIEEMKEQLDVTYQAFLQHFMK